MACAKKEYAMKITLVTKHHSSFVVEKLLALNINFTAYHKEPDILCYALELSAEQFADLYDAVVANELNTSIIFAV